MFRPVLNLFMCGILAALTITLVFSCSELENEDTLPACQDGKDNDGDGRIDCNDEDCKGVRLCQQGSDGDTDADTDSDTDSDADADADGDADADADGDADADADGDTDADADSDTDTDADTDADNDTDTDADADTDTDSDTDTDTDTDADTDTDSDTDSDTDTDSDSDSDTDTDPELQDGQYGANFVNTPPTIDGTAAESFWRFTDKTELSKTASGASDNTAVFDAVWDNNNLYIVIQVLDPNICVGDQTGSYNYDSAEIYIDPDNSKSTEYNNDFQMIFKYSDDGYVEWGVNSPADAFSFDMKGSEISGGYVVEVSLPWSGLGATPAAGTTIGFDIGINDDDPPCSGSGSESRDGELRWWGDADNYQNTSHFGEIVLFERAVD